jgi:hypothetical protein
MVKLENSSYKMRLIIKVRLTLPPSPFFFLGSSQRSPFSRTAWILIPHSPHARTACRSGAESYLQYASPAVSLSVISTSPPAPPDHRLPSTSTVDPFPLGSRLAVSTKSSVCVPTSQCGINERSCPAIRKESLVHESALADTGQQGIGEWEGGRRVSSHVRGAVFVAKIRGMM